MLTSTSPPPMDPFYVWVNAHHRGGKRLVLDFCPTMEDESDTEIEWDLGNYFTHCRLRDPLHVFVRGRDGTITALYFARNRWMEVFVTPDTWRFLQVLPLISPSPVELDRRVHFVQVRQFYWDLFKACGSLRFFLNHAGLRVHLFLEEKDITVLKQYATDVTSPSSK